MHSPRTPLLAACLLASGTSCGASAEGPAPASPWNVLIVTVDTLRADHLSCYGYFRDTSPRIDALAAESVLFESCTAPISHTQPSHASLFTGTYPLEHGTLSNLATLAGGHGGPPFAATPELRTLAQHLLEAGYRTGAFVSASPVKRESGLDAGFDAWDEPDELARASRDTQRLASVWMLEQAEVPFLCWLHLFDPHRAYTTLPEEYARLYRTDDELLAVLERRGASLELTPVDDVRGIVKETVDIRAMANLYDGAVRYVDDAVGAVLDDLRAHDLLESTLVVLTADHGEGIGQHGEVDHGHLWREQLWVPLIVRAPGAAPRRVSERLSLVDALPTAFGLAPGLPVEGFLAQCSGRDVLRGEPLPVFSMLPKRRPDAPMTLAIELDGWRFLRSTGGAEALFDLGSDPFELVNLRNRRPEKADELRAALLALQAELERRGERHEALRARDGMPPPSQDFLQELNALGYGGEE